MQGKGLKDGTRARERPSAGQGLEQRDEGESGQGQGKGLNDQTRARLGGERHDKCEGGERVRGQDTGWEPVTGLVGKD